jgi:hypothetical protein
MINQGGNMVDKRNVTANEALDIFLKIFVQHSLYGTIDGIKKLLENGSAGMKKKPNDVALHEWYLTLDDDAKKHIGTIIRKTAELSTFSALVVLDNKTIGYPIEGQPSDFALYLQTYEDSNGMYDYSSSIKSIRFNRSYSVEGDLHDSYTSILREHSDPNEE